MTPMRPKDPYVDVRTGEATIVAKQQRSEALAAPAVKMVSVIVPMYDAASVIGDQLTALSRQTYDGEFEVIVADNGSTDGSTQCVLEFVDVIPQFRLVDASDARGASHARNVGSRAARGELILYADADDIVGADWVAGLVRALQDHHFVAGWQHELEMADGGAPVDPPDALPTMFDFLPWAFGGNCGIRRDVFDEVGGWQENHKHGGDDVDFCFRVQLAGYPIAFVPAASVWYRPRPTLRGVAAQYFEFGSREPLLLKEFRELGAKRPSVWRAIRIYGWILSRLPYLLLSERRQRMWVAMTAGALGRLWGSVRWRTLCL
jgi:glycosyltransferase involved in cell wall biosynthesis